MGHFFGVVGWWWCVGLGGVLRVFLVVGWRSLDFGWALRNPRRVPAGVGVGLGWAS
jgi:hypothetical protein